MRMTEHLLEIAEPIWNERSVGMNLENFHPDDLVRVEILHERKTGIAKGLRTYPDPLYIRVGHAVSIGKQQRRAGATLTIVPISQFFATAQAAQTLNRDTRMFSQKEIDEINKAAQDHVKERGEYATKELLDVSKAHVVEVINMEWKEWTHKAKVIDENTGREVQKETGTVDTLVFTIGLVGDEEGRYRTLQKRWNLAKSEGCEFPDDWLRDQRQYFSEFLIKSFQAPGMPPAKSKADMLAQLKKYMKSPFRVALRNRESLWRKDDGTIHKVIYQDIYYTGDMSEVGFRPTVPSKQVIPLNGEEQRTWDNYQHMQDESKSGGLLPGEKPSFASGADDDII